MPGLGITTDTDQPSVAVETISNIVWATPVVGTSLLSSFSTNLTGVNTGAVGTTEVGSDKYVSLSGIATASTKSESNVDPLVAEDVLTNIEVYTTIYNITRGTQLSLDKFNPVVPTNTSLNVLTFWNLESDTLDASLYDDIRSLTTGRKALIKPSGFPPSSSLQSKTALDLSFTGCFSSEFEFSWYIKSLHTGNSIKGDTRREGEGLVGALMFSQDIVLPERAVHSGDPILTESYVDVTVDSISPAEDAIVVSDVPVRLVSDDTFDVVDKNGVQMDLTGTFEWIDSNGVEQSVSFPQSLTDTETIIISLAAKVPVESAGNISREIAVTALAT